MGAFFVLLYLVPIQIITLFLGGFIEKLNKLIPFINLGIIISILIIPTINENLFYKLAAPYTVLESLFIVLWVYMPIKWLRNKINYIK